MIMAFEQIEKSYFDRTILQSVSFRLDAGSRIGLIGPNGCGKTTLLRIAEGLESPDMGSVVRSAGILTGYLSQDVDEAWDPDQSPLSNRELERLESQLRHLEHTLAATGDDPVEHRRLMEAYTAATARFETRGGYDYERNMKLTLDGLGLAGDVLQRPLSSLSGGERMRVRLARLLLLEPDLLLLDEPTNHLDMAALEWLEQYIAHFRGAVLVVSHDRAFLDRTVNGIIELSNGLIREGTGNYTAYMEQKKLEEETRLREMARLEREIERQQGVVQTMLSHRKMSAYHAREKVVRKLSDALAGKAASLNTRRGPSMRIRFLPEQGVPDASRVLIRAEDLSMGYGEQPLFTGAGFVLRADDRTALVGPNGCGKTTLLRILLGEETALSGQVWLSGTARMGYMGQFASFVDENHTVEEEVEAVTQMGTYGVRSLLARFGFRDTDLKKKLHVLSGGERSRLYLCILLENTPDVLLLDEPTNHLDIASREILEDALVAFPGAILAVSHDRYFIAKCCAGILGFVDGVLKPFDNYEKYRTASLVARASDQAGSPGAARSDRADAKVARKTPSPVSVRAPNRAEERKQNAARKERLRRLEVDIETMERERDELEQTFGADTPPDTYETYTELVQRIESAYETFVSLSEET